MKIKKILFVSVLFSIFLISCGKNQDKYKESKINIGGKNFTVYESTVQLAGENLFALKKDYINGEVDDWNQNPGLFYLFTENQKKALQNQKENHDCASLQVTLRNNSIGTGLPCNMVYGFLHQYNFSDGMNYIDASKQKPQVGFDFSNTGDSILSVSMCIPKVGEDVIGFYVSGETSFNLDNVKITQGQIGWDISTVVPLYAFSVSGGKIDFSNLSANFTGGRKTFDTENSMNSVLPKIEIKMKDASLVPITSKKDSITIKYGTEEFLVRRSPAASTFTFQTSGTKEVFTIMNLLKNADLVDRVMMTSNSTELCQRDNWIVDTPLITDLGMIFDWPKSAWRDRNYELFRWEQFPKVLFFDFDSYKTQDEFLSRLAFFVEKEGYKGTFVDFDFIKSHHGYNAHDYKPQDLARFFTEANRQGVELGGKEKILLRILVKNGIVLENGDGTYEPGEGAIISFSRESVVSQRYQLMAHEAFHGIYFTDAEFRKYSDALYDSFDSRALDMLKAFFTASSNLEYDVNDDYLMKNEFMAYMLQQAPSNAGNYFVTKSTWYGVRLESPAGTDYVIKTDGKDFTNACQSLSEYVERRFGCWGGRTYLVTRK